MNRRGHFFVPQLFAPHAHKLRAAEVACRNARPAAGFRRSVKDRKRTVLWRLAQFCKAKSEARVQLRGAKRGVKTAYRFL